METMVWIVDKNGEQLTGCPQLKEAAILLSHNEVVAFPTETVYGLGGNALVNEAIDKIYAAKGRPSDNPLIVHISDYAQLKEVVSQVPEKAEALIKAFWPGPLTLVLPKGKDVADKVTAGLDTVAVRMPDHPVALALIELAGVPIAAPSANLSGKPSPTAAKHVYDDLKGRISGLVDGGETGVGVESTVVDCTEEVPMILRPGGVTKEQLEHVVGEVSVDPALSENGQAPRSPGVKYKHYAPKGEMYLVSGGREFIQQLVRKEQDKGHKVGVLTTSENETYYKADLVLACGVRADLQSVARRLYDALRTFDDHDVHIIFSEVFPEEGVGKAVMNRLEKAASGNFICQ
ncbi:L-threonylcarbamoyladenylate synthase [Anaerobacillus sp. MEB173]|uniref:L-threonylcarbamoyladenylate synthase n=1 Tax=Anaerobacillus sp. MEB173 TaxID=3383345 RepID=UPI003F8F2160